MILIEHPVAEYAEHNFLFHKFEVIKLSTDNAWRNTVFLPGVRSLPCFHSTVSHSRQHQKSWNDSLIHFESFEKTVGC